MYELVENLKTKIEENQADFLRTQNEMHEPQRKKKK